MVVDFLFVGLFWVYVVGGVDGEVDLGELGIVFD